MNTRELNETTISSEQVFDGRLLNVNRDKVQLSDGDTTTREWIKHPGASAVVPLFEDGTTLLVKQFRYAPRQVFLEVPAGKIDIEGESPEEVAIRELEEETGWVAQKLTALGGYYPAVGYSDEIIYLFIAEELTPGEVKFVDGEFIETIRLPLDEALEMIRGGEIRDMKTISALYVAAAHRSNGKPV